MVDITFLLLIFFLASAKFVQYEGKIDANLPRDRGLSTDYGTQCGDRLDFLLFVADPGELVETGGGSGAARLEYRGRRIRVELGAQKFFFYPNELENPRYPVPGLEAMLEAYKLDMKYIPVSIYPRKGVTYGDVLPLFEYVMRLKPEKISFMGTFEND